MDARSERLQRAFEVPVIVAAVLVVPLIIMQAADLTQPWYALSKLLDWGIWLVFAAEVVVMLAVVPSRRKWVAAHPLDVIIVVLTPPFLSAFAPVRLLRLLMLLRLFRLAPLVRRLLTFEGLRYAAVLAALTAVAGGAAFAELEPDQSAADGIYWAITTMTTVGYGDPSPTTTGAKLLAVAVMLIGTGFVAMLTGAIAQRFLGPEIEREAEEVEEELGDGTDSEVVRQLREVSERLRALEAALQRR